MTTDPLPPRPRTAICRPSLWGKLLFLLSIGPVALSAAATPTEHAADADALAAATATDVGTETVGADSAAMAALAALPSADVVHEAAAASPAATSPSLGDRAAEAASATLAALLPRLATNDTLPLLDRSVLLAGDLSRLLNHSRAGTDPQADTGQHKVRSLVERATALLGTPYRWGGASPDSGFDCSGLVSYVFRTALGIELPRISREMARKPDAELIKNREDLQQGDLVFFGRRGRVDHVGIYMGEGRFLHAPSRGKDVRVDSITGGYWGAKFMQARRVEM